MSRKENRAFNFSVEGQTEKWYLLWLARQINAANPKYNAVISPVVERSPLRYSKSQTNYSGSMFFHVCDVEGQTDMDIQNFEHTIDEIKGSKLSSYTLGYSNLSFELWMILHKADCFGAKTTKVSYLRILNKAYETDFENLDEYKEEANFKKCLGKLSLVDVYSAVERSKRIMAQLKTDGKAPVQYRKITYYRDNPSLTIGEVVEKILNICKPNH